MSYIPKKTQTIDQRIVAAAVKPNVLAELESYLRRSELDTWREHDTDRVIEMVKDLLLSNTKAAMKLAIRAEREIPR